jgi:hypothetical protein
MMNLLPYTIYFNNFLIYHSYELFTLFGPERDEVTGGWRKLHNEELHGLYSSPRIIRVIKARRMR